MQLNWYALYTRPRFEKKVEDRLLASGFEAWLPVHTVVRQWSDRKKKVVVPLFNSYVFIKADRKELYRAVHIDGVARTIHFNGAPAPIPEDQIELIKKVLAGPEAFEVQEHFLEPGDPVRVTFGPLKGNVGKWVEWRGKKRMAITLEQLNHTIILEVPAAYIEKIKPTGS